MTYEVLKARSLTYYKEVPIVKTLGFRLLNHGLQFSSRYLVCKVLISLLLAWKIVVLYPEFLETESFIVNRV